MKKQLLVAALLLLSGAAVVSAQPRSVGVNLGYYPSISYQHTLGANMLDVAAQVMLPMNTGFGLGGHVTYDWIDPFNAAIPWEEDGAWHWYMGVGGAGGFVFKQKDVPGWFYAGVAGHIGIEYDFWFPLQLSLDWRPSFGVNNYSDKFGFNQYGLYGISLGVRYLFNQGN